MALSKRHTVVNPNLGLYLGISPMAVPKGGLIDCNNVRIRLGKIVRDSMGWSPFPTEYDAVNLDGKAVTIIANFQRRDGSQNTIFGNTCDLFQYDSDDKLVYYITPVYTVGLVDVANGSPVVMGDSSTEWLTELKPGDAISFGSSTENDPAAIWYEIESVDADDQLTLTINYAEGTQNGIEYTARQLFTGDGADVFFDAVFYDGTNLTFGDTTGDRWYACNGIDRVVAWDGDDLFCYYPDLGNIDSTAFLVRHKNQMIYEAPTLAGDFSPVKIRTSEIGEPENTVSGDAAELVIKDGPDRLLSAYPLGEQLVFYAEKSVILAQYVGPPLIYAFRAVVTGYGPFSARAVAVYPDYHDFLAEDLMYRFDGASIQPVNSHVWRDVMEKATPERAIFAQSFFDDSRGELIWTVPLNTDAESGTEITAPETAYVDHYLEDVGRNPEPHTRRDLPATAFGTHRREQSLTWADIDEQFSDFHYRWSSKFFRENFPLPLFGDQEGNIYILNGASTQDGVEFDSYARFGRMALGNLEYSGIVSRLYPDMEQDENSSDSVTISLYGSRTPEGNASLLKSMTYGLDISGDAHFVSPRVGTRFLEVVIGTEAERFYWATNGFALDVKPGSGR